MEKKHVDLLNSQIIKELLCLLCYRSYWRLEKLLENCHKKSYKDIYVSIAPDPWEWEIIDENFLLASQLRTEGVQKIIYPLGYLKIIRVFPVKNQNFKALDWTQEGVQFWKDLVPLLI